MHQHQLLITSLLSGFSGGLFLQAPVIFFHWDSFRWKRFGRLGIAFSLVFSGLIWALGFIILAFILYSNKGIYPEDQIRDFVIKLGIILPLGSAAFELCYAAICRSHAKQNREPNNSDLE